MPAKVLADRTVDVLSGFHFVGGADEEGFLGIFDFVAAVGAFDKGGIQRDDIQQSAYPQLLLQQELRDF